MYTPSLLQFTPGVSDTQSRSHDTSQWAGALKDSTSWVLASSELVSRSTLCSQGGVSAVGWQEGRAR